MKKAAPSKKPASAPAKPEKKSAPVKKAAPSSSKPVKKAAPSKKPASAPAKPVKKSAPSKQPASAPAKPEKKSAPAPAKPVKKSAPVKKTTPAPAKPVKKAAPSSAKPVKKSAPVKKTTPAPAKPENKTAAKSAKKTVPAEPVKKTVLGAGKNAEQPKSEAEKPSKKKRSSGRAGTGHVVAKSVAPQEYSDDLSYSRYHAWVMVESMENNENYAKIGITDYLLEELGNIENLDLPLKMDELEIDSPNILIHTGMRKKHVRCPLTGRVVEVNQEVLDDPSLLFKDYRQNWLFRMEFDEPDELDLLMSGLQYSRYLDEL